ncbi:thioredoxin family protein [Microbacterium sp. LWS13-1.2]|uniref:Thioredoxin family protein n=1 Tax=Microbacterium sp. LWS13-1.2 TaxID=3135264 RepID=A0AAU6SDP7_9MICO
MKRATVIGTVVGAVVVAGVAAAIAFAADGGVAGLAGVGGPSPTSSVMAEPSASPSPDRTSPESTVEPQAAETDQPAPGAYVDYSEDALAAAGGTRVLFFHAPWCPQCRALESDILAAGVPAGVTVLKVDYDSRQDLRQQYGVRIQTTVVALDEEGNGTAAFVAYDEPTLAAALSGLGLGG